MIRLLLTSIILTSCVTTKEPDPAPSAGGEIITKVGDKIDLSEQRAAAAVTVAVEQADKPAIVRAEGSVALAYLTKPTEADLLVARARASSNADQKVYDKQIAEAKKMQEEVDKMWSKMEAEAKKSQDEIKALKARNEALLREIEQVKEQSSIQVWSVTGAALVVIGGIACAFASVRIGVPILLAGAFAGAVPHIINSQYFAVIAGTVLFACASLAIWWLFDKVRDSVNDNGNSTKQP